MKVNKFWGDVNLAFIFSLYPMSLIFSHLFFFEEISPLPRLFYGFVISLECILLFGVEYLLASLSSKMHKSYKILSKIQLSLNKRSDLRLKLKLQSYFERLCSQKSIGISIATLTVLCYPLLSRVFDFNLNCLQSK